MPFRGILFLLRRFRLFEFGHHALHFPADFGGAEIADAAFVGVAHLARGPVRSRLHLLAYAAVGACGFFYKMPKAGPVVGTLVGCLLRFAVHFISGVTIYKIAVPTEVYGFAFSPDGLGPVIYSLVYNGGYMLFNTIIAVVVIFILQKAARKLIAPQD